MNLTLKCGQSEDQERRETHIRMDLRSKLSSSMRDCVATLGGADRRRAPCTKPPSLQLENPAVFFAQKDAAVASKLSTGNDGLPPFPLILKPRSTAVDTMAMVTDEAGLRHFCEGVGKGGLVIERFIQHDNVILKVGQVCFVFFWSENV